LTEKMPEKNSGPPLASVIILTYNEEKNIRACLEAVFRQKLDGPFELIVVDSGSTDRTREIVREYPVRLLEIPHSEFGHGRTRQWASEKAGGEFLVYLVADAMPADDRWLAALVKSLMEDQVLAGSYSRQVARPDAHPVEKSRIKARGAGGDKRIARQLRDTAEWAYLKPLERLALCDFDDVSACRRASLLEEIPIPDVPWAEDLFWSRKALEAGYKIVFQPDSVVIHSHPRGLFHEFKRGWLDQRVAKDLFGHIYFADLPELFRKYFSMLKTRWKTIAKADTSAWTRIAYILAHPVELVCEVLGNYLASREVRTEAVLCDFINMLNRAHLEPGDARGRVMRTRFIIPGPPRRVLFSNPNSRVIFNIRIPEGAALRFGAGINPEAWPRRKDPVRFGVDIQGRRVWEKDIPVLSAEGFSWEEVELGLDEWRGQDASIMFSTQSADTDYAWAGWAEPRVVRKELEIRDRVYNWLLKMAAMRLLGAPLRHP
jgi:rhamnosyltransferase